MVELDGITSRVVDSLELLDLVEAEEDVSGFSELERDHAALDKRIGQLEFTRMFPGEMDAHSAYLDIQAGAGGTEAQDWADMLMRMYLRWADERGFKVEVMDESRGEVAGIKGASLRIEGDYAYGWLRT